MQTLKQRLEFSIPKGLIPESLREQFLENLETNINLHMKLDRPEPIRRAYLIISELNEEAKTTLEAVGDCDHSVGVCSCQLKHRIAQAEEFLKEFNHE